ncbi:molybdopterin-guanine dinucleotide biosynthesis protein MobD [Klebsiella variicola]|uniref:Uncharacterized protein n=1 Tax=Klebsiella phage PMBT63 TaxID=3229739 RepID=A0AB39C2Z9_9CAUD|nr:molybdopterin-guanine dinucleotide biosynthesis protein MobD [Klebsiella variicola]UGO48171.1 hypothetical protein SHINKOU_92 [Klebsiella phage vB_KaeM_Shinkou]WPH68133.1 molybdopterin-guanine dinucleotide biosynthesis protein [Klebsiella phage ValerieMcCarty02]
MRNVLLIIYIVVQYQHPMFTYNLVQMILESLK